MSACASRPERGARLLALLAALAAPAVPVAAPVAAELNAMSAVNQAGRQRMLSQRIAKAYCQAGLDVRRDEAERQLADAVRLFDQQLAALKRFAPTPLMAESLARVEAQWQPLRKTVTAPYSRAGAEQVMRASDELLQAAQVAVTQLEVAAGRPAARLVNLAGRQRMLSQRIAKFYMLRALGFRTAPVGDGLAQAYREFLAAHEELRHAPGNSAEIGTLLTGVGLQLQLLEHSIQDPSSNLAEFVALTTEKILVSMEAVTSLYEAAGAGAGPD